MKTIILNQLIKLHSLLHHIIALGVKDGIYLYFLDPKTEGNVSVNLKSVAHPFLIRGATSDRKVVTQVFYQKDYEISLPFEPSVIVDCGSNIGLAAIYFKNRYPRSKVIAIEPEPANFQLLQKNLTPYSQVILENKGIWSKHCHLEVIQGPDREAWSFFVRPAANRTDTTIEAIGIADIMSKYDLDRIDLLKVDIEGAEYELFEKNYEYWLPRVRVIIIELHDRFRPFSSRTFLKVLSHYDFNIYFQGENIIAEQIIKDQISTS